MTDIHLWQYLAEFFLERNCFRTKVAGKLKTHILFSITFFFFFSPENCAARHIEEYGRTRQATDGNTVQCAFRAE